MSIVKDEDLEKGMKLLTEMGREKTMQDHKSSPKICINTPSAFCLEKSGIARTFRYATGRSLPLRPISRSHVRLEVIPISEVQKKLA